MAQSLRVHFAARRSNTYPLSETSGDDLDSSVHMCFKRPTRISASNVVQMKLTPRQTALAPFLKENVKSQERSSVPSPENVNKKSSCLQISLQPTRYSGCLPSSNVLADGDDASFACVLKDGIYSTAVVDNELNAVNDGNLLGSSAIRSGSLSNFSASENGSYSSNGSDYGSCTSITSGGSYTNSILSDSSGYTLHQLMILFLVEIYLLTAPPIEACQTGILLHVKFFQEVQVQFHLSRMTWSMD